MAGWLEPLEEGPRCRKWRLHWSSGSSERRRRKNVRFDGGKREALAALREFEAECEAMPEGSTVFRTWAEAWNDSRLAARTIADKTHEKYTFAIATMAPLLPELTKDITPSHILAAYATMSAPKSKGGRQWSGTTLNSVHNALKRIFRAAFDDGLVRRSPIDGVDAPKVDTKRKRALSPSEVTILLDSLDARDHRHFAAALIVCAGLRAGEVCSLRWSDVGDGFLEIRRECTKTDAGVRTVPLDDATMNLIKIRKQAATEALESVGAKLYQSDHLCCGDDGRPLKYDVLRRWWERNRKAIGLEGWVLHELRHTYLTNLAQAGVHPAIMQRLAGHSSMRVTMEIYTHVNNNDLRNAVDALSALRYNSTK